MEIVLRGKFNTNVFQIKSKSQT